MSEIRSVRLALSTLQVSTLQFKPYVPTFEAKGEIVVEVPVPDEYWADEEILTLEGIAYVSGEIGNAYEKMHIGRKSTSETEFRFMKTNE